MPPIRMVCWGLVTYYILLHTTISYYIILSYFILKDLKNICGWHQSEWFMCGLTSPPGVAPCMTLLHVPAIASKAQRAQLVAHEVLKEPKKGKV